MAMVMTDNQREQQQVDIPTLQQINLKDTQEQHQEPGEDVMILLEDEDDFHLDPNEQQQTEENQEAVYYLQDHDDEEEEEEEEEEAEDQDEDEEEEDQFNIPQNTEFLQEEEEIEGDEAFYLANRTFYTTCHKISRQNSPSYRKRPPYTFLENWLIHSVFSKSQQILLRFPVIHPKVMMTEGDFIYTPHQMATESTNESDNQQQQQYYQNDEHQGQHMDYEYGDEEEYDYYDDAFIIGDEGVMVMSASAPDASQFMAEDEDEEQDELHASSLVMDENMWMGHSRYNSNGLTLHVVNPDDKPEEDDDPMYHNVVSSNNPYKSLVHNSNSYQGQLQMVQEEEEEEEEEEDEEEEDVYQHRVETADQDKYNDSHHNYQPAEDAYDTDAHNMNLSMSPEVLNWYRSADLRPVTLSAPIVVDDSNALLTPLITCDNEQQQPHSPQHHHHHHSHQQPHQQHHAHCGCSSSSSSTSSENSSCSISSQRTDLRTAHSDEKSITQHSAGSYQSLADIMMEEDGQNQHTSYGTLLPTHYQNRSLTITDNNNNNPPLSSNAISPLMQVSVCLVDAAWVALDLAQAYVEEAPGNKGIVGFITCMFRIWKVLFLGAETMLGWGNHRLSPQAVV